MPPFAEVPGVSLPVQPPFPFEGMAAKVFPLRARLNTLQRFVDNYLNIVPPEVGRFRVAVPYVYLCVLDYGKMAIEVGNYGWLAQREILFNVAVEWYKVVDGRWQFHDWASVAPFIYVDDDMSMAVGRSVYGWPKTIASITPTTGGWVKNPQAPVNVATISTNVFKDLYAGGKLEQQPLLEIDRRAPITNIRVPFDPTCAIMPWTIANNVARAASDVTRDALKLLPGLGLMPRQPGANPANWGTMGSKLASMFFPFSPDVSANTINLKQFRMSEDPRKYCYQALTNGPMRFTGLSGAGVLGEQQLLLGDISGGHSIRLYQWPTLPIAETLGLEVEKSWRGPDCDVAMLKPVSPFWYKANVVYEPGTTLAWRGRDGVWRASEGKTVGEATDVPITEKLFNTALGASNRSIAGPFRFPDATVRVLPLLAHRKVLSDFVEKSFNTALEGDTPGEGERLKLWAGEGDFAYVYLTVSSLDEVTSDNDNIGDWTDYELSLAVPVRREFHENGKSELRGVGLVQAFTFCDNATAAAASAEVLGIATSPAHFIVPEHEWMSSDGPASSVKQPLLNLEAQVLPVVGGGEKAVRRTILELFDGEPPEAEEEAWRTIADSWGGALKAELKRKKKARSDEATKQKVEHARAMALDLLSNTQPVSIYTIKQFRDVAEPDRACYQSFVRVHRTLRALKDFREIERPIHVRVREYPTLPLVSKLGLIGQPVDSEGGGVVYVVQPIRPFWLSGTIEEALGTPVSRRDGSQGWTKSKGDTYLYKATEESTPPNVYEQAGLTLDVGDPRRLTPAVHAARGILSSVSDSTKGLTLDELKDVLRNVDPQMVIESLLSREWGNWDPDARWRSGKRAILERTAKQLRGESDDLKAEEGMQIFEQFRKAKSQYHPWLDGERIKGLATLLKKFTDYQADLIDTRDDLKLLKKELADPNADVSEHWKRVLKAVKEVVDADINIEGMEAADPKENLLRLLEAQEEALKKYGKLEKDDGRNQEAQRHREGLVDLVEQARERCRLPFDSVVHSLSKAWQKPDYVVPRSAVGPDKDRILPLAHSWDADWYVGPPPHDRERSGKDPDTAGTNDAEANPPEDW